MANMCCKRMYGEVNFSYAYRHFMYFGGLTTVIDNCSSYFSKMAIIFLVSDDKSSVDTGRQHFSQSLKKAFCNC
jgi:hypothetical protein